MEYRGYTPSFSVIQAISVWYQFSHHYARRRLKYTEILQHDMFKTGRGSSDIISHICVISVDSEWFQFDFRFREWFHRGGNWNHTAVWFHRRENWSHTAVWFHRMGKLKLTCSEISQKGKLEIWNHTGINWNHTDSAYSHMWWFRVNHCINRYRNSNWCLKGWGCLKVSNGGVCEY